MQWSSTCSYVSCGHGCSFILVLMLPKPTQTTTPDDSLPAGSSSASESSSSDDEGDGLDQKAVDRTLLQDYINSHTKTGIQLNDFLHDKEKKLTQDQVVKHFYFALDSLEKTKNKTDWPVCHLSSVSFCR
jgi:hypothetical protein